MLTLERRQRTATPATRGSVLHDIDLTLADGEIVGRGRGERRGQVDAVPGRVRARAGLDRRRADRRRSRSTASSMAGKPLHEFATRVGIGFQNPATQLSGVTGSVFEEVALGPMNLGLPARETVARTKAALAILGIEALAEREPRRLSGGQAQLVVIASLLAMRPAHLVLDEPTAQLDPEGTRLVGDGPARAGRDRDGAARRRAQDRPARRPVQPGRSWSTTGRIVLDGPARRGPRRPAARRRGASRRRRGSGWPRR